MKFTITINQAGVVEFGLADKTDFTDWAILGLLADLETGERSQRLGDKVWLNFKLIMTELPLSGINTKPAITRRVKNLESLGLLIKEQTEDDRMFAKTTELYKNASSFKVSGVTEISQVLPTGNGVLPTGNNQQYTRTVHKNSNSSSLLSENETGGNFSAQPAQPENSDITPEQQNLLLVILKAQKHTLTEPEMKCLIWAVTEDFWRETLGKYPQRFKKYLAGSLGGQYQEFQAKKIRSNATNTRPDTFNNKNGYETGGNYETNKNIVQFRSKSSGSIAERLAEQLAYCEWEERQKLGIDERIVN